MPITYSDIEPHLPGTNADVAAALNADKRMVQDADIEWLQRLMVRSGMVRSVGFAGATGIIADLYDTFDANGKRIADEFLVALVSPFPYPCSHPEEGEVIVAVNNIATAQAAQLLNGYTAQTFTNELILLTGGLRYMNVTAQQVADVLNLKQREDGLQAVRSRADAAYEAAAESFRAGNDVATFTAAAEAAWSA